jgi:hypothetical protein
MKSKYYILPLLLFCTTIVFAQSPKFTASATKTEVGVGEPFEVDFSLNGNGTRFTPPDFSGFQVVSGPNIGMSTTVVNGAASYTMSYGFTLIPASEGTFVINAAAIVVNGHTLTTNSLICAAAGPAASAATRARTG